jgi:hypothetical protein
MFLRYHLFYYLVGLLLKPREVYAQYVLDEVLYRSYLANRYDWQRV